MATNIAGSFGCLLAGDYLEQKYGAQLLTNQENTGYDKRRACKWKLPSLYLCA